MGESEIKDLVARRFMRAMSLHSIIQNSMEYCINMGSYQGWGVNLSTHAYDMFGERGDCVYSLSVRKAENVERLSDIKPDMTNKSKKIEVVCHFTRQALDFVAVFNHKDASVFGLVTGPAYERLFSDYGDFPDELEEFKLGEIANFGNWYAIETGNTHVISSAAMVISLSVEFAVSHGAAVKMAKMNPLA